MKQKKNFEASIMELGDIVRKLENDQTPLEEAMELFEQGVKLTKECNAMLDTAQQKINILIKNENGEIIPEKFENND